MVVALMAVPLFASEAWADFTADTIYTAPARISATTDNQPIIGFTIPAAAGPGVDTLKTLAVKSYIERSYSINALKLWVETNGTAGWQSGDSHLKTLILNDIPFQTQDTVLFSNINRVIRDTAPDTFYLTVDAHTDSVNARAYFYHEHGLEVVIDSAYMHLGESSGQVNTNWVNNSGYHEGTPAWFDTFKVIFDTQGPPISLLWCFADDGCKTDTVDQLDSICIRADTTALVDPGDAIDGDITLDLSEFCLSSTFKLIAGSYDVDHCFGGGANAGWDSCVLIPDTKNCPNCIDVDSGHVIYATAEDSAGNETTASLYFDKPIDTCKPVIDSIHFFITYDANGDGIAAIGDSLSIVAWGLSNADFEVDSMIANLTAYFPGQPSKQWQQLDDVSNNNRLFRKKFMLEEGAVEMAADSSENRITIWAWDNACNYDTAQQMLNAEVDLQKPAFVDCYYFWHWDIDTFDCIGIEDSVWMGADLTGSGDLASVVCDLVEAGIYGAQNEPLFDDGDVGLHNDATADDGIYNLLWEVGEPPIEDGKDVNNTVPPPADADYSVKFTATDNAGNWDTCRAVLNRTLDSRRPRWTNQDKMYIKQMPDAKLAIFWPTSDVTPANSCNEKDAAFFYIYVDSGDGYGSTPFGATFDTEYKADTNMWISEVLSDGKYYRFKIKQEDDCGNFSVFSKEMGAVADGTPPHVCIAVPDSGLTFGDEFLLKAVADSVSHDADSVCLWYRFRRDLSDPLLPPGPWERCRRDPCCCMMSPGDGWVWTDTVRCISGYTGWVEIITVACDLAGNCQDTTMGYDDACLVVDDDVFRPGHFLIWWDTLAPGVMVTEVDGFPSPQTACGYDVWFDSLNWVIFDVDGADEGELFEVEVRALSTDPENVIFHQDNCAMPCTVWFSVDGWDEGTQDMYIYVKDYDNETTGNAQVQVCVPPPPPENCVYISWPHEWMRIPCTGTSGYNCVEITADVYEYAHCSGVTFNEARFEYSDDHGAHWYQVEGDVIGSGPWTTCWDNTDLVEHGDTIYFRVIAHDEFYMADTSYMVKVFVDCEQPQVSMLIEDVYYTCGNETPKVPCAPLTLKAVLNSAEIDIDRIRFFVKRHSLPDLHVNWEPIQGWANPAWSDNIWVEHWDDPCCEEERRDACLEHGDYFDIRVAARDIAGHYMFDYDNDGFFDDSTFNDAVAANAGITIFVDDEAPEPAISKVCDQGQDPPICFVNPSELLDGADKAYVQAGNDIMAQVSILPSEDTCEVMKVHWYAGDCLSDTCWAHVGTSTDPNHYPITFNPLTLGLLQPYELEDGWWQGYLKAELHDSLGNVEDDIITMYILDVTPSQAVIVNPLNDSYVWGDVYLSILALNAYEIAKVCYEYSSDGENWMPINGGVPNNCVTQDCVEPTDSTFALMWHTLNTVEDGSYYLRAVATDCDNNVDEDPPTIMVTVANGLPSVVLDDPRICERECPDSPLDTLGYIGGTVTLSASATSDIPVTKVEFYYKSIFGYPDTYTLIGYDMFPTSGKYTKEWSTSSLTDGRYHLKARVYNAAGRWADSDPVTVSVDNSAPYAYITAIMGEPVPPEGIDVSMGDVIDIELWAMDSTSDDGWTRCYNSGLVGIELCLTECDKSGVDTKCFEVSPVYDGFHTIQWNVSGLEFDGCSGCYEFYVKAWDCLGNVVTSDYVEVNVYDVTAPITTIAGFDGSYIYGYSSEQVSTLLFEYADSGGTSWIPIGLSECIGSYDCDPYETVYLYKTSWDPGELDNGNYQIRVISHDECSNQDDDMAPWAFFEIYGGNIIPYDRDILDDMTFIKNWCTGDMQGIVQQTSSGGAPVMIARYGALSGSYSYECVHMQAELQHANDYAGSFDAYDVRYGGEAMFFSSITMALAPPPMTGDPAYVTYLATGTFDIAKVKSDLGTHGTYQEGCVDLTIPDGAFSSDYYGDYRYIWVAPTLMEWAPVTQPDILPIGDEDGYATHISFTDCNYCCGWWTAHFDGPETPAAGAGTANGSDCCLKTGKYAKVKMCYDPTVEVEAEHLAVAWWDCDDGEYCFDYIYYPATVEGFDTEAHTVEFATTCLKGPFVVVQLLERECEGTISVNMLSVDPYCNGYTGPYPRFTAKITDNVQGTQAIDRESIVFKVGEAGNMTTIYDGWYEDCDPCDVWARGYGQYPDAGYDPVSGFFRAGWNDPDYYWTVYYTQSDPDLCPECKYSHTQSYEKYFHCPPAPGLASGDGYMSSVTARNYNIQTCTATMDFSVDAVAPTVDFADSAGAYVGKNPHFCIYFNDAHAGMDKSSIYIDIWGDETSSPDPNNHQFIGTLSPAQLDWMDDTTVCVDGTFEYRWGYLHVYVYGGPDCLCQDCSYPQYYYYKCGVSDCVENHTDVFWQYFTVDADKPTIALVDCGEMLMFQIEDEYSGVAAVHVYEDGILMDEAITQDETNPEYWWYSPASGVEKVDIKAIDNVGNIATHSFTLPVDCAGPTVIFADGYVCKNPTIEFWVTDEAGVDWTSVNVYISGCGEDCYFYAEDLGDYIDTETGKVTISGCHLDCYDGNEIVVYVYSGDHYRGDGPKDVNGNYGNYRQCSFVVDDRTPTISVGARDERPIEITISDDKSGVDWSTLEFWEDGLLICSGLECMDETVNLDTIAGKLYYDADEAGGFEVEIRVNDKTGCNLKMYSFDVYSDEDLALDFEEEHNEPNPFNPDDGSTIIVPGLSKCADVTAKIYDFAGEFVRKLDEGWWCQNDTWLKWDGKTNGGTTVANGTYLCYIHARDAQGQIKTAVIKITVLKQDE
jgi:hypothetical protein